MQQLTHHHSNTTPVQYPLWQGQQAVHGLWFACHLYSEAYRQAMLVQLWQAGAKAYRFSSGDLLLWPRPRLLRCDHCSGLALCKIGSLLSSAPLTAREIKQLQYADAFVVQAAQAQPLLFADATLLNPAQWLNLHAYIWQPAVQLRVQQQALQPLSAPDKVESIHEILGSGIPQPAEERNALLKQLLEGKAEGKAEGKNTPAKSVRPGRGFSWPGIVGVGALGVAGVLGSVLYGFMRLLSAGSGNAGGAGGGGFRGTASSPMHAPQPAAPGALARFFQKLKMLSQLSRNMDKQHAAYMRKMLALFEQNDLDEALRHAIPMGGAGEMSLGNQQGMLRPRDQLQLSAGQPSIASLIGVDNQFQSYLSELYEKAFEQYDKLGAIDKAVYVLAELFSQRQRALDYLEQHERYAQAADLYVAWEFPAASAIRLYVLAGQVDKAHRLALQSQEYATAIQLLEADHPQHAVALRKQWAQQLIAQGRWLEAVEAIWVVEGEQQTAISWLRQAEQSQGELGIRAWLQRLALQPEHLDLELERAQQLCQPQHARLLAVAIAEIFAIYHQSKRVLPPALINLWTPFMLLQYQQQSGTIALKDARRWLEWTENPLLRTDVPRLQPPSQKSSGLATADLVLQAPAAGLWEIYDAWPLSLGRSLLALGEAGMLVIDAEYQQQWRLNLPVHRIILSDSQEIALLLAYRQDHVRVQRVNLVTHDVTDLGITHMDACADTFDGVAWLVADAQQLQVVDTRQSARQLLFSPTPLSGRVTAIARHGNMETILLGAPENLSFCRYQLPYRRTVEHEQVDSMFSYYSQLPAVFQQRRADATVLSSDNRVIRFWYYFNEPHEYLLHAWFGHHQFVMLPRPPHFPNYHAAQAYVFGQWFVLQLHAEQEVIWLFYNHQTRQLHLKLHWPAGVDVGIHFMNSEWVLFDKQGRLMRVNAQTQDVQGMTLG